MSWAGLTLKQHGIIPMKDSSITAKNIFGLIAWILISLCAGLIGSQFRPGEWYKALAKPFFTPPDFIFAPVWTLLYVL
ncbi:MAG TPA: tryptophan-rich sensory protein, partial [Smithellaceae bacterium]|nr:tryptophan-rich sensory protein [Smithellaceae bacterium]